MILYWLLGLLGTAQTLVGARVLVRLGRSLRAAVTISEAPTGEPGERVSVVLPVLDEEARLPACLDRLIEAGHEVAEILVADGGSTDGTRDLIARYAARDPRVRLVDAAPVPVGWNGKAWGLQVGWEHADPGVPWLLTIDADVRPAPVLARALVAHARRCGIRALSVATRQQVDAGGALLHPALLATLVYRFGAPGSATREVCQVQANGQCALFHREALAMAGGFALTRDSRCEDVTIARQLASLGDAVGFYEAGDLVSVQMYANLRETWRGWPRSLPMHDRFCRWRSLVGLVEVTLVQALPLPLLLLARRVAAPAWLWPVNLVLLIARLGVLYGTSRAYAAPPPTYWLSPLCDLAAAFALWRSVLQRHHTWRGRKLVPGGFA